MPESNLIARTDVPAPFHDQMHVARVLADSTLLPAALRGKPANVLLVLGGARALDVPWFWALQSMHVIEGKLSMSADLMRALVIRAGHSFRVLERTREKAVVEIKRKDRDTPYRAEFTAQDAREAELLGKGNWKKYTQAMMVARATSIAVRDECPDLLYGMTYTPDELGAVTDEEGAPVVDGEVVGGPAPDPDPVASVYADLMRFGTTPEQFVSVWQERGEYLRTAMVDADVPLENAAAEIIAVSARHAETAEYVKRWFYAARDCGLLDRYLPKDPQEKADDPPLVLGNYLIARGEFLNQKATADTAEPVDAEVVDDGQPAA